MSKNNLLNVLNLAQEAAEKGTVEIATLNGTRITVKRGVFVPDNETLLFVSKCIEMIKSMNSEIETIADAGVGSGVIAVSLGKAFPAKKIYGYDISERALKTAKLNAKNNNTKNVVFYKNYRLGSWINRKTPRKIDLIVSNPPYVGDEELRSADFKRDYPDYKLQPKAGLLSLDRVGLRPYISILKSAKKFGVKYLLFRCNTENVNAITSALAREKIKIEVIKTESKALLLMRVTLIK